jgi:hypothetical protein
MWSIKAPIVVALMGLLSASSSIAQVATNACAAVYSNSVSQQTDLERDFNYNRYVFDRYCNSDGTTKSFSLDTAGEAIIQGIPFKGTLGIKDSSSRVTAFCRQYADFENSSEYVNYKSVTPNVDALRSFNDCLSLLDQGIEVTHVYDNKTPDIATIRIAFDPSQRKVVLSSVQTSGGLDCSSNDVASKSAILNGKKSYNLKRTTIISCRRPAKPKYGGQAFLPAGVQLGLNSLTYDMTLPQEGINGPVLVSEGQAQIDKLNALLGQSNQQVAIAQRQWDKKTVTVGHIYRSSGRWEPPGGKGWLFIGCSDPNAYLDAVCKAPNGSRDIQTVYSFSGGACGNSLYAVTCVTPGS